MRVRRTRFPNGLLPGLRLCLSIFPLILPAVPPTGPQPGLGGPAVRRAANSEGGQTPRAQASRVRESVPDKYLKRYLRWKSEYLSTEAGRRQWERYVADERFTLTIVVSPELGRGGLVSDYGWDDNGKLVAATITLGSDLDAGLPPSLYYPVTSALAAAEESAGLRGDLLAAAKLAHEFGHVNRASDAGAAAYERQSRLAGVYARLFQESGYNARDPRLAEVTRLLGGTPFEVKRAREQAAEANALAFLRERMSGEDGESALFKRIKKSVKEYGDTHLQFP